MIDAALRPVKDRLLGPLVDTPLGRLPPVVVSAAGLLLTLGAAVAAWRGAVVASVVLWLCGRVADGLDGLIARAAGRASDLGGLVDLFFDAIGYAAVPLGLAFGVDSREAWVATAVVLASFYVNVMTLGYASALLEKRALGAGERGEPTSAVLPRGLIEGAETIVFFTVALAFPAAAPTVWWIMAVLVAITAADRVRWALGELR